MAKASSSISKAAIMMANGKIIICMAMANYIIPIRNQLIKGNGSLISFMAMVKYTMINLHPSMAHTIILTSIHQNKNGTITKEIQSVIPKKVWVSQSYLINNFIKGSSEMIKLMGRAGLSQKMDKLYKGFGKIVSLLRNFDMLSEYYQYINNICDYLYL